MNKTQLNKQVKAIFDAEVGSLAVGETLARNHEGCPAGVDTRERLYFTRKEHPKDLVVWFCHNCGEGGAFSRSKRSTMVSKMGPAKSRDDSAYITEVCYRSLPVAEAADKLSQEQRDWLRGSDTGMLKDVFAYDPDIKWDYVDNSIVFVLRTPNNTSTVGLPDAIQKRYHSDFGPKCLTYKENQSVKVRQFFKGSKKHTFIVEDYLSGRALHKLGYNSYILFGNNMDIAELAEHRKLLGHDIVVWLDNDNDQVIENSHKICKRAKMLGYTVHRVPEHYIDPKKYNREELWQIVNKSLFRGAFVYE